MNQCTADDREQLLHEQLQAFARQASYTCNLYTNGKLSPQEAYQQLARFWARLEQAKWGH
ncbi:MAG: hypothetical protein BRC58_09585 [Cyanobacteria bacterium QS_8_64_29]|nr:MAG: hypothetical protein BRC58_09585 [Cyanobacteria bacterium QS_8_64_29]